MHSTATGVSVVLCCYNSAKRLPETLNHLFAQQVPEGLSWEIIIIDNNSTDDTVQVASGCRDLYGKDIAFRIVPQPVPGLSSARDKGIETAKYDYILFCDDDNWLDPNYVANGFAFIHPDATIGVAGGLAVAEPEPPVPSWFEQRISHYAVGDQEKFAADGWVYGAGSICRKNVLLQLKAMGWKQVTSDRLGDVYLYGGDNEICYMLKLLGYTIRYNASLTFKHFIPQERLNEGYIGKSAFGSYLSGFFLYPYFYYLSKKFKKRSTAGFFVFFMVYYGKTFFSALFKFILPLGLNGYQKQMNKLELRAAWRFLPNTGKVFDQFRLIHGILKK